MHGIIIQFSFVQRLVRDRGPPGRLSECPAQRLAGGAALLPPDPRPLPVAGRPRLGRDQGLREDVERLFPSVL